MAEYSASSAADVRSAFIEGLAFGLDDFQREAFDALDDGHSVVVAAPTGSGKTLVAEYAVATALSAGRKAFYTTPLKALSNQKYHDLIKTYGSNNVGLLTGDNVINPEASIVVMTTEVLRNMIYAQSPVLSNLAIVVLDEVHYLQNAYRGPVWEEVIVHAPQNVRLVCLSATVSNAEQLAEWIGTVRGNTRAVIEERRPVELEHRYLIGDAHQPDLQMLPTFKRNKPNPEAEALDAKRERFRGRGRNRPRLFTPRRGEVIDFLNDHDMLPAIYFIFSRAACDDAVRQCVGAGLRLTSADERREIRTIAENATDGLSDEDLEILHYNDWLIALELGIAAHHAGMVPPFKEAVEECFTRGLIKAVFATETLALGINMPARSVVLEKLTKFQGERHEFLTPGEYTQLTGRAGRRGIDNRGYAVVLWSPFIPFEQVASLASTRSYELTSSFRPTYNMAANLVHRYEPAQARHLLNLSFAQYRTDVEIVRLEHRLDRLATDLEETRGLATCELGDVDEYRSLLSYRETDDVDDDNDRDGIESALDALRPGDIIAPPKGHVGSRLAVLSTARRRNRELRLRVLTTERRILQLTAVDFVQPPRVLGKITLPTPFSPNNAFFRRRTAQLLLSAKVDVVELSQKQRSKAKQAARKHPVATCPDAESHVRAAKRVKQLEAEIERLRKTIKGRSESIARQFDRVLRVLEDRGYVRDWSLTESGERLSRLYHESDLLVAETLLSGVLDGTTPAELALLVSGFTYETRGTDGPLPWFNNSDIAERWGAMVRIAEELTNDEQEAGLPMTRLPDGGFTAYAYAWASGESLDELLDDDVLSGGDFVRNAKQLLDLLRQLGEIAPITETRQAARAAADAVFRDLVAASTAMGDEDEK